MSTTRVIYVKSRSQILSENSRRWTGGKNTAQLMRYFCFSMIPCDWTSNTEQTQLITCTHGLSVHCITTVLSYYTQFVEELRFNRGFYVGLGSHSWPERSQTFLSGSGSAVLKWAANIWDKRSETRKPHDRAMKHSLSHWNFGWKLWPFRECVMVKILSC